jgi:hypothetical protein
VAETVSLVENKWCDINAVTILQKTVGNKTERKKVRFHLLQSGAQGMKKTKDVSSWLLGCK